MLRNTVSALVISTFTLAGIAPASAGSDRLSDPSLYEHNMFDKRSEFVTGAYVRLPFRGGLDPKTDRAEPRFGFAMTSNFANRQQIGLGLSDPTAPKLVDLSMGFSGRDTLKLNGMHLTGANALYADEEGEKKKKSSAPWVLIGVGAAVGVVALAALATCTGNKDGPPC